MNIFKQTKHLQSNLAILEGPSSKIRIGKVFESARWKLIENNFNSGIFNRKPAKKIRAEKRGKYEKSGRKYKESFKTH